MSAAQSAAHPAGLHAALTGDLFTLFLAVTGFFFLLVLVFLGWAIWRRDRGAVSERRLRLSVAAWAALITLGLFGLTIGSYFTDRALALAAVEKAPVQIRVTAQQWWWEVEYRDGVQANNFRTANELHLPVGEAAHIQLVADDVIHSLWIPNLAGKQDLIPGRPTDLALLPRKPGRYRAQCAEFCGLQHAHMALDVIVDTPEQYAAWRARSLQPARPPATAQQRLGYNVFMNGQCASCHAIAGTPAFGSVGPDLTRVASRATLAAGTEPNVRAWLERWIADPQGIKPGNRMPQVKLTTEELKAVSAYLETLS
jgi:cytochrome c oxidase subunit 2